MSGGAAGYWAHTPVHGSQPHLLDEHLEDVAGIARELGERVGLGPFAEVAGLWHDIGKAHPSFQRYLKAVAEGRDANSTPHAIWGAAFAHRVIRAQKGPWREVALPIAGHHAGLKHPSAVKNDAEHHIADAPHVTGRIQDLARELDTPEDLPGSAAGPLEREMRIRMLLSVLVDADRLDTEAFTQPEKGQSRGFETELGEMWETFLRNQEALIKQAPDTEVNRIRHAVYEACLSAAESPQGVFRLTVPTGGGKTRSGLAFALKHAIEHDLERVIVAIPYTSIVDQTVDTYRGIFHELDENVVLEHHSRMEFSESENQDAAALKMRLATENWEAPLIVTTTVQLFESLLAHHPSQTRKIHRTANSVVLLDEFQTLPVGLLRPTTDVLRQLVEHYGSTVVLSTATQPAVRESRYLGAFEDLGIDEIVPSYPSHFEKLRRVEYEWRSDEPTWEQLGAEIQEASQALAILNTRQDALDLVKTLPRDDGLFHLSTVLCPAHRRDQLDVIRRRLEDDEPVRVVSTQVVEAGVDLDFPRVYRALGPLDRVVQAAGRCNREGTMGEPGQVVVFDPAEGSSPPGAYRSGLGHARTVIETGGAQRLHDPDLYRAYFQKLYTGQDLDDRDVQDARERLAYRDTSSRYRLIDQDTVPVVVDYGDDQEGPRRAQAWLDHPSRRTFARLQAYTVNLYRHEIEAHEQDGWVTPLSDDLYRWDAHYDDLLGIREELHDPTSLIQD